jgi:stalled ribosome alternative rescue factor ArfA
MRELFRGRREKVKQGWGKGSLHRARDEGGSGDMLDSGVSPGPGWRVLYVAR